MEIRPDLPNFERIARQRQAERDAAERSTPSGAERTDSGELLSIDEGRVAELVERLRGEDPTRLHRLEDLRQRIADGSYRADPEELVDPLLEALERGL